MEKFILFFIIGLCSSICTHAKIWRINNNNGVAADFTTIQSAHDGAKSGDTLHLEGSPNHYGGLTCTKKLVIIGPGYFLDQNTGLQALSLTAKIQSINYQDGSNGSEVMGIDFQGQDISVYCNDIVIRRNNFSSPGNNETVYYSGQVYLYYPSGNSAIGVSNIIISQNFGLMISMRYPSSSILITNNYIALSPNYGENGVIFNGHADGVALIQNNIFKGGRIVAYNTSVSNNIVHSSTFEGNGNLISNNIGSEEQFGTTNGNKSNVDMTTVFVGTGSSDAYWKLKAGSPAVGAGYGSTTDKPIDCGMFSGYSAYKLSGIPPVPTIYSFENQPIGSTNDPIDVTVKVRSNN